MLVEVPKIDLVFPLAYPLGQSGPTGEPAYFGRAPNHVVAFFPIEPVTPPAEKTGGQETQAFSGVRRRRVKMFPDRQ